MDWLERLNRGPATLSLGQGTVEVLSWAYRPHLPDNSLHRHTFFEVCLMGDYGAGEFTVQDKVHPLRPGDLFIARPGVVHQIRNTQSIFMELYWVCFQWTPSRDAHNGEADCLLRAFAESPALVISDEAGRITALWKALRAVSEGTLSAGYELQYSALASALLIGIADLGAGVNAATPLELTGPDAGDVAARLAVRFIHDNLNQPLTLPEIAAQVYVSPRHLSRIFAKFTGTSPALYITHARLDRAQGLLRHSELAIKTIAAEVGYPDVHHFTRAFASHFGCPPGVFRRRPESFSVPNIQKPGSLV